MGSRTQDTTNLEKLIGWTKIKKESPENEIKEFAETAMNELLGWYGYEKMARDDSTLLQSLPQPPLVASSRTSSTRMSTRLRKHSSEPQTSDGETSDDETNSLNRVHNNRNSVTNNTDTIKSNITDKSNKKPDSICGWCNKQLPKDSCQILTSASGSFCSELCFSQSRRASFKKNKTCDWCRHVRHTVSYVDFQDGASQLQFCSDKCLNQYKMHIFCREAQAHLELLPHVHVPNNENAVQQGLITPDLWLRNCRSPSNEPLSPSPVYSASPPSTSTSQPPLEITTKQPQQTSPLPLITVAHPSKLMSYPDKIEDLRTERTNKTSKPKKLRRNSNCSSTVTSSIKDSPTQINHPQDLSFQSNSPIRAKINEIPNSLLHPTLNGAPIPDNITPSQQKPFLHPPNILFGPRPPHLYTEPPRLFPPNMFPPTLPPTFIPPAPPPRPPFPSLVPPVTVLVPYPIVLPIPLPIPIPIPLNEFLKAASASLAKENSTTSTGNNQLNENNNIIEEKINVEVSNDTYGESHERNNDRNEDNTQIFVDENQENSSPLSDSQQSTTQTRPLRKRKRILTKDTSKEINCKTRKLKYLSV